ncbi:ABC transporter permease [Cohnella mopanensis]|uniref:ABC transporter permease n=1 Tax=Cohnella mopanensis TaxID=2911966 RepID=UPI001EF8D0BD|nr:ABC transporter permease [Cohnella mopanensis]
MKGLYRLINIEFAKWLVFTAILCIAAIIMPLIVLPNKLKNYNEHTVNARFEDLYISSGNVMWFVIFLALIFAFLLKTVYADYWGSKSIYNYLTLPVKREALYFSKLFVFATCLLMLLASQLISIRLGYALYADKVGSYGDGQFVMHNGFFLAMIRSEFFRLLLPLSFSRMLSTFGIFLVAATGFYYGALCERSRKYYGFAPIVAAIWITINVIGYRMSEEIHYSELKGLYVSSVSLLVLSGFFVWHSLRIIKRGAVA